MVLRTVLAGAALAATLAPTAQASCHWCGFVQCETACQPISDVLEALESEVPGSRASSGAYDTVCHVVLDTTHLDMHCHH